MEKLFLTHPPPKTTPNFLKNQDGIRNKLVFSKDILPIAEIIVEKTILIDDIGIKDGNFEDDLAGKKSVDTRIQ